MTALAERAPVAPSHAAFVPGRRAVPAVHVDGLSKSFRVRRRWRELARRPFAPPTEVPGLQQVTLEIAPGEFFGVLGPNGAGKSTLFRILATYMLPDAGHASVFGRDIVRDGAAARRLSACVMANERSLDWRLTAEENLRLFAALHDVPRGEVRARIRELLESVELADTGTRLVGTFSSGMKQRLLIARALLPRPQLLLLDEPTRSLDPLSARSFREVLRREVVQRRDCTVLLATHSTEEALDLCDRVSVLDRGRLLAVGSARELSARFGDSRFGVWTRTPGHPAFAQLAAAGLVREVQVDAAEEEGWSCVRLSFGNGADEAARVLGTLTQAGVTVARFERLDLTIGDLIGRVVRQVGGAACA